MARISLSVGRKTTSKPSDAGYVADINRQMKALQDNIIKVMHEVHNVTVEALEFGVQPIFDTSQELVPIRTGKLKESGFVYARRTSRGAKVDVGYGKGGHPSYVLFVHERTDIMHKDPTQAKFLSEAVQRHMDEIQPRIVSYMKQQLGSK